MPPAVQALRALIANADVVGYVGATVLESSGLRVPVSHDSIGPDRLIGDQAIRAALDAALASILAELETLPSEEA